jgi:tRNA(Arg) A34 adenosine deaminase TadA
MEWSRRKILTVAGMAAAAALGRWRAEAERLTAMSVPVAGRPGDAAFDGERMRDLAAWTAQSLATKDPNPFGCEIVHSATGERLMRGLNAVSAENDPSSHAEVRTMRLACAKLKSPSLKGYTLYTTCEPCPMCMSDALWAGVDRVVYGATIADANRFTRQIRIPATEVAQRSDMKTVVVGPVEQAACVAIFEDARMQAAFKLWSSNKDRE